MTTTWPGSGSEAVPGGGSTSQAFHRFHPDVQRWIYDSGWQHLREIQELAAPGILAADHDLILSASTASGKSEAAWLPMCSVLRRAVDAGHRPHGLQVVVVSPLKALINDQYERLTSLCERVGLPVHRWHGDVPGSRKRLVLRTPSGLLLITPESIEALFVRQGFEIDRLFGDLRYIVIDELHSFVGTARGAQLQSLLHRIELRAGRGVPRIALSATLGSLAAAAEFLRPGRGHEVEVVTSQADAGAEVRLQVRGYVLVPPAVPGSAGGPADPASPVDPAGPAGLAAPASPVGPAPSGARQPVPAHASAIADHVFATLRCGDNLVFANSRASVEQYADLLTRRAAAAGSRTEFLAHHGSLAQDIREQVESRLRDPARQVTAICTSTLEMGIDVGTVDAVAQLGAPLTVTGLRQRLGRSGRRTGRPAVLRVYVWESQTSPAAPPPDALRGELFQTVAMVELLLAGWYEPPHTAGVQLSTLIQQVLSVSAERGGERADRLYQDLCRDGPFTAVSDTTFAQLLRDLGRHDLIRQDARGFLLPGGRGDRLLNHYSFYAAFRTSTDHRLVAGGRTIGTLPVQRPLLPGTLLIFAGRRWRVVDVDLERRVIHLTPSDSGQPPSFAGNGGETADEVRKLMRDLYLSAEVPRYLDPVARRFLAEGREQFRRHGHATQQIFDWRGEALLFPWRGDRIMNTLLVTLASHGWTVGQDGLCLTVRGLRASDLWEVLADLAQTPPPDPVALARTVRLQMRDKYDHYLGEDTLALAYASRALDVPGTWGLLADLAQLPPPASELPRLE